MLFQAPAQSWLVNAKLLSPLIAAYEDRLEDRDRKLKNIKTQLSEFNNKLKALITENLDLHKKIEIANTTTSKNQTLNKELNPNEWEEIKKQAFLVLEENQLLKESINLSKQKKAELDKENAKFKARILNLEQEKIEMQNYIDRLTHESYHNMTDQTKYVVPLEKKLASDYLIKIEELKYNINAINSKSKYEKEELLSQLAELEKQKFALQNKINSEISQNKQLKAENDVTDNRLKKIERKIRLSQKKQQLAELKEKIAYSYLNRLTVDFKKIQTENEAYENLIKAQNEENKNYSLKVSAENLKLAKMEDRLEQLKMKANQKLERAEKIKKKKESEYLLNKIEYDKKFQDFLTVLKKKDIELDEILHSKKKLEDDIETIWKLSVVAGAQMDSENL
jgi:centrosomal protein CEP89